MHPALAAIDLEVSRLGGHAAVDLLNTVDWRLAPARRSDRLSDYEHVLLWLLTVGLLDPAEADDLATLSAADPSRARHEHRRVLGLREDLYEALTDRQEPSVLVAAYRDSLRRVRLHPAGGAWDWVDSDLTLMTPRDRVSRSALDVFSHPKIDRFRQCEADGCGWTYLDTSPRADRRWCSSASCGNRARARRHYERTRTTQAAPG